VWEGRRSGFFDELDHGVEIRPVAGIEFGMDEVAIGADFERAALRGKKGERRDALSEFEDLGRQTDGLWCVVSDYAVFDRNFCLHSGSFPMKRVRNAQETVKGHGGGEAVAWAAATGGKPLKRLCYETHAPPA
jgi:hypothetical protein